MYLPKSEKQQQSEARRLEAVKQRQRERNVRQKHIAKSLGSTDGSSQQNNKIIFHSDDEEDQNQVVQSGSVPENNKDVQEGLTLFDSSDSENEEDESHRFEIKSQFEGQKGKQLFEMSSGFTDDRFKLDERFKEIDAEVSDNSEGSDSENRQIDAEEKEKNLEILEKVLGFQVTRKPPADAAAPEKRKRLVRFDPESEDASKFIQKPDPDTKEKTKSKKKRLEKAPELPEPVVSNERYFEVAGNLKDLFDDSAPAQPFTFGQMINSQDEERPSTSDDWGAEEEILEINSSSRSQMENDNEISKNSISEKNTATAKRIVRGPTFFLGPDDPRLKEGVSHFRRRLPLEKVKENWLVTRNVVLDLFKKNKRTASKNPTMKPRSFQPKKYQQNRFRRFNKR